MYLPSPILGYSSRDSLGWGNKKCPSLCFSKKAYFFLLSLSLIIILSWTETSSNKYWSEVS